ncbi:LuxR C-terminal-related transcriptional regulator [Massilia norwichensis]|uniref:LuxR C-terminal-related transcriptional regulator n=1 Tax=Massilia norwichensis TaxID=1442366 RepID=A0ABT2AB53_9BURK|nr:LuxR C-terminal-related transcriptional regulator [Massilia norwichensis]MCS0591382.1 LuxR C-terminal-related transcriptional regulator [Massilia norwichensis]
MSERSLFALYTAAQDLAPVEFAEVAFGVVRKVLPVHSGMFGHGTFEAAGRARILSLHRHDVPLERVRDRENLPDGDPAILNSLSNGGRTVHTCSRDYAHDPSFERYIRRYDSWNVFTLTPGVPFGTLTDAVTLWAGALKRSVDPARLARRGDEVLPHLLLANSINRRLHTGDPGPACAVAATDGVLLSASPAAYQLLDAAWPNWRPPHVPEALMDALKARGRFSAGSLSATATLSGNFMFVRLQRRAAPTLSAAEWRVATMAVAGATYKEIAIEFSVSPSTVRNQLHAVYVKLGLRNKTELAQVLADA